MNSTLSVLLVLLFASNLTGMERVFRDVPSSHWAAESVRNTTVVHRLMDTFEDGTFRGDAVVSRMALVIAFHRFLGEAEDLARQRLNDFAVGFYSFRDVKDGSERVSAETLANEYMLFDNIPTIDVARLSPGRPVTRFELAAVCQNMIRLLAKRQALIEQEAPSDELPFDDVPAAHWALQAVVDCVLTYELMIRPSTGSFRGDFEASRYDLAFALSRAFGIVRRK